jgi:hypothetical protein
MAAGQQHFTALMRRFLAEGRIPLRDSDPLSETTRQAAQSG